MRIGINDVLVGIFTFQSTPTYRIPLMSYQDPISLTAAVTAIPYLRGSTYTGTAIEFVIQQALTASGSGNRPDAPDSLIVMTDGQSNNKNKTLTAAQKLHATGTDSFAIGIGNGPDMVELAAIASRPGNVKVVSSFHELSGLFTTLFRNTCFANITPPSTSTTIKTTTTTTPTTTTPTTITTTPTTTTTTPTTTTTTTTPTTTTTTPTTTTTTPITTTTTPTTITTTTTTPIPTTITTTPTTITTTKAPTTITQSTTATPVSTPALPPTECVTHIADIVFLLDSSGSVGETDFRKLLDFVSAYAQYFTIGPGNVQMSVITFASDVTTHFDLNTYDNSDAITNALQNIPYKDGGTHTEKALQMALYHSFTRQTGDRPHAKNVLLVITDGYSYDRDATLSAANMLHLYQIETIAVGVGQGVDMSELQGIATDSSHVFTATNFDSLGTLRSQLNLFSCT